MKKGFTLAEVLVTLTILGVVMAVTIPVLNNVSPDKDPIFYKKGSQSIQAALNKIMNMKEVEEVTDDNGINYYLAGLTSESRFCELFAETLNISGKSSCNESSSYNSPNFITTDGIRFWGFEGKFNIGGEKTVYFDRKLSRNEINNLAKKRDSYHEEPGLKINISYNGHVSIPDNSTSGSSESQNLNFDYENKIIGDF